MGRDEAAGLAGTANELRLHDRRVAKAQLVQDDQHAVRQRCDCLLQRRADIDPAGSQGGVQRTSLSHHERRHDRQRDAHPGDDDRQGRQRRRGPAPLDPDEDPVLERREHDS